MKFLQQLLLLLWKNFTIRKKNKVRIIIEIIGPVFFFLILIMVRLRDFRKTFPECHFVERSLASNGLLPFFHSYLCETNDECNNYTANNNYDDNNLKQILALASVVKDLFANNKVSSSFNTLNTLIHNQRNAASVYTRSLSLVQSVADAKFFIEKLRPEFSQENDTLFLMFLNSSPNFNLLYNHNYSKSYREFDIPNISKEDFNFLYGSDLDRLDKKFNQIHDSKWIRSHLCDLENLTDLNQLFRVNSNKSVFYKQMCELQDENLKNIIKLVGKEIDLDRVKLKVVLNTNLMNSVFWNKLKESTTILQTLFEDLKSMDRLFNGIQEFFNLFESKNLSNIVCGRSKASLFKYITIPNIEHLLTTFPSLKSSHPKTQTRNKREDGSQDKFYRIIDYLNQLSELNQTECPQKTKRTCLCESVLTSLEKIPGEIHVLWKQLKVFFVGKIVYSPNTTLYNNLIKEINITFKAIEEFRELLSQVKNEMETFRPTWSLILNLLPTEIKTKFNYKAILLKTNNVQKLILLIRNLLKCVDVNRFQGYENEYQAVNESMKFTSNDSLWATIIFDDERSRNETTLPNKIKYKIRMSTYHTISTLYKYDSFYRYGAHNCYNCNKHHSFGFIYLQDMVEKAIIEFKTKLKQNFGIVTQMAPYPCYATDYFVDTIRNTLPLFMVLAWLFTVSMLIKDIVYEKEKRLKEFMRVMGLSNIVHWAAWFITTFILMILTCLLLIAILKFGNILTFSNFSTLFVYFCCFSISIIPQCFLISVFFDRANIAAPVGGIIYFLLYMPYIVATSTNSSWISLLYLSSTLAFGHGCQLIATFELQGTGLNWETFYQSPFTDGGITMNSLCLIMLLDAFLYMILTSYIENVWPSEFGVAKPFYYPFQLSYWTGKANKESFNNCNCCMQSVDESVDCSNEHGIQVKNLHKIYSRGRNHALKDLTVNFYENQITSLLGNNGAGKSTLIHILTGLYTPSSGKVKINGLNIAKNMDKIRKSLGFVPQHNILFGNMSVINHLWFYARLKGSNDSMELKTEVEKMLVDTGLENKRNELAKNLSGGMQRKLSVAIAFVGSCTTVILDEPSAGVDPNGRRDIWDLLLKYRSGRTIVITTHHMDEADILGNRIVIISNGKLICEDTGLSLKRKYGCGYYLTLFKKINYPNISSNGSQLKKSIGQSDSIDNMAAVDILSNNNKFEKRKQQDCVLDRGHDKLIDNFVQSRFDGAVLFQCNEKEITYTIPNQREYTKNYEKLFNDFEINMHSIGIDNMTIRDTTLEEIFVSLTNKPVEIEELYCDCCACSEKIRTCMRSKIEQLRKTSQTNSDKRDGNPAENKRKNSLDVDSSTLKLYSSYANLRVSNYILPWQHLYALVIKRFHHIKHNRKSFIVEFILPILFIIVGLYASKAMPIISAYPPIELHPWLYQNNPNYIFYAENSKLNQTSLNDSSPNEQMQIINTFFEKPSLGTRCMKNHKISAKVYIDTENKKLGELSCLDNGYALSRTNKNFTNLEKLLENCICENGFSKCSVDDYEFQNKFKIKTDDTLLDLTGQNISDWLIKTEFSVRYFKKRYGGFEFLEPYSKQSTIGQFYNVLKDTIQFLTNKNYSTLYNSSVLLNNNRIKVWYNNKGFFSSVGYLNAINNAILREKLRQTDSDLEVEDHGIIAVYHPFNFTKDEYVGRYGEQVYFDQTVAICIIFSLSFLPASILAFLVEERRSCRKRLQFISGIKPYTYWICNFIWDLFNYALLCVIFLTLFLVFELRTYTSEENFPCLALLMFLYGWSCIPLMYVSNYLFRISSTAFVFGSCLNVSIGILSIVTTLIIQELGINDKYFLTVDELLKTKLIYVIPHYSLGRGLIDMSLQQITSQKKRLLGLHEDEYNPLEMSLTGKNLVSLFIQGIFFFLLNILIEYRFFINFKLNEKFKIENRLDEDVEDERNRVLNLKKIRKANKKNNIKNSSEDYLTFENLTKVYRKFKKFRIQKHYAVKSLCLGIKRGECFGLIGINGAGKTTTFKMLTGDIPITSGDIKVNGHSVFKEIDNVYKDIGYCPQKDAIFPLLTARENLTFYARLRGIPRKHVDKVVIWALNRIGLNMFADRRAGDFSGGNKRKLSTAIALIGNPTVIALDEPTSGMDTGARYLLWNDIQSLIKEDRIIILTSHNMEECEALCTRMVIMVNGEFKCLGSPQYLKLKFGTGYRLTIRLHNETYMDNLVSFMKCNFPTSKLNERHSNISEFLLKDVKLSNIFGIIERNIDHLNISEYSINQTSLDQIFVEFAKQNKADDNDEGSKRVECVDENKSCYENQIFTEENNEIGMHSSTAINQKNSDTQEQSDIIVTEL